MDGGEGAGAGTSAAPSMVAGESSRGDGGEGVWDGMSRLGSHKKRGSYVKQKEGGRGKFWLVVGSH